MDDVEYFKDSAQQQIGEQTDTPTDENTEELSNYEKIVAVAEPVGEHYTLERLDQKEIFSDFSEENLKEIMKAFDVIIDNNKTILLPRSAFVTQLFSCESVEYNYGPEIIFVDTDIQREVLKYAMLASVYIQNFPENTFPRVPNEMRRYLNSIPPFDIIVSFTEEPEYEEAKGYKDINGNPIKLRLIGDKDYRFSSTNIDLQDLTPSKNSATIHKKNLLEDLRSKLDLHKIAVEKGKK
jgi:hypothetical protein